MDLTTRERRWFEALLVLATLAVGYVVFGFGARILADFGDLFLVFFLAWLLAFALSPLVTRLTWAIPFLPRVVAVVVVYASLLGGLGVVLVVVAGAVFRSISDFVGSIPTLSADLPRLVRPWEDTLRGFGISNVDLVTSAQDLVTHLADYAGQLAGPLQGLAVASLGTIGSLLLIFILSIYMIADRDDILAFLFRLVPPAYKEQATFLERSVARSFGGFLRGQTLMGLAYGMAAAITSLVLGLGYLPATSALAGVLMAIPFFGPFGAWAPPVLVAAITAPDAVVPALIVMLVAWLLVMNVLQPRLMANALRIHPVVVLGSVLLGMKIAGIGGAVFGIPIAAVLSASFFHVVGRASESGSVTARAVQRVAAREGRPVRIPREPTPGMDPDIDGSRAATPAEAPAPGEP